MLLRGYIDESGNGRFFTLSMLDGENPGLDVDARRRGKRFFAKRTANCEKRGVSRSAVSTPQIAARARVNSKGGLVDQQIEFFKKLLNIFERNLTSVIAYSIPIDDFKAVFPDHASNPFPQMYGFLVKFIMLQLVEEIEKRGCSPKCTSTLHCCTTEAATIHTCIHSSTT